MLTRRAILRSTTLLIATTTISGGGMALARSALAAASDKVTHTDAEWQRLLTADQYDVLRHEGTERAFTSALLEEHREGTFSCAGCDLPLFSSKTKFDSGTGWPSFWQPLANAVIEKEDTSYGMTRTAVECRR